MVNRMIGRVLPDRSDMIHRLYVTGRKNSDDAKLHWPGASPISAKVGRAGLVPAAQKQEGDGKTPMGRFGLRQLYYRPDRLAPPRTALPVTRLRPSDLWCDDPHHVLYNRPVRAPFAAGHERMWRKDRAYDLCLVLDYNLRRPEAGRGSAIFFHLTGDGEPPGPTEGCVAICLTDMLALLPRLSLATVMEIAEGD